MNHSTGVPSTENRVPSNKEMTTPSEVSLQLNGSLVTLTFESPHLMGRPHQELDYNSRDFMAVHQEIRKALDRLDDLNRREDSDDEPSPRPAPRKKFKKQVAKKTTCPAAKPAAAQRLCFSDDDVNKIFSS